MFWEVFYRPPSCAILYVEKRRRKPLEAPMIWMDLHRNWSLKGTPPQTPPTKSWHTHLEAIRLLTRFTPSVHCLKTSGCPSSHWCVCRVGGFCCGCCIVRGGAKVFVSPSPGPSVCSVSGECVWCCGSSSGRRPDQEPRRTDPHLETNSKPQLNGLNFTFDSIWVIHSFIPNIDIVVKKIFLLVD